MAFLRLAGFVGLPLGTATQILDSAPAERPAIADAEMGRVETLIWRARGAQRLLANARDCPHSHAAGGCPAMQQTLDRLFAEHDPSLLDPASVAAEADRAQRES
ncbi:hypothetical protein [Brevibacterium yomogidense]|uniref:hypothetical protein n=1 Tax=Brevibacterium yomogidense TaxID=946573 RepID=UPI0018DF87CB|nr:hypothetical protein [Brevibacterium yomogidense]